MAHERLGSLINHLLRSLGGRDGGRLTDGQLLERLAQQRDHAAFESLLWRHGPMVLGVCQRVLRNRHDAEDAFQAVFLVFFRKVHTIARRDSAASWLHKVAFRIALKAQAEARTRRGDNRVERLSACEEPAALVDDELRSVLDEALQSLPAKYRLPLISHYLEGKTVQQTAEEIGCPPGTVSGRLNRAKLLLRRRLLRRGVAIRVCQRCGGTIHALAFAPDGRTIAAAGLDGVIRVCRLSDGAEVGRLTGHRAGITSVAFTPDGRTLASSSNDGTVLLWDVKESKP